jgi:hypothetical protein
MERQFFDWTGWDGGDEGNYLFYNPTLKVDLGPYKAGETLKTAIVDYQYGWMELHDDQEKFVRFTLTLKADLSAIGHPEE